MVLGELIPCKVISGGQSGADQAGLEAAARFGIATGGWMPKGYLTVDGPRPDLAERCGLREHPYSAEYPDRTELNVRQADGPIRFAAKFDSPGEKCTFTFVHEHHKPRIDVDMLAPRPVEEVGAWIRANKIKTLNVSGNVEPKSKTAQAFGITAFAIGYLSRVFEQLGHQRH